MCVSAADGRLLSLSAGSHNELLKQPIQFPNDGITRTWTEGHMERTDRVSRASNERKPERNRNRSRFLVSDLNTCFYANLEIIQSDA